MDTKVEGLKPEAEVEEYADEGRTAAMVEFEKKEAKLRRKLDLYIAPVMMMLMLISYLDRGNIGFAATQGMADDIGLKGNQLNVSSRPFSPDACPHKLTRTRHSLGCRLYFLRYIRVGRAAHIVVRQALPIPPCHSRHHLRMGFGVHELRLRAEFWRSGRVQTSARMVRRGKLYKERSNEDYTDT